MRIRFYHFFCILGLLLTLNGCGFQLRGYSEGQKLPFRSAYIDSNAPYSDFTKALRLALNTACVSTPTSPPATVTLQILSQTFSRTITSLGNAGQTTTYLLSYGVIFQLTDRQNNVLLSPQQILVTRNFSITSNQLSGDLNTQTDLREDMQQDAIQQLITRLSSPAVYQQCRQINSG